VRVMRSLPTLTAVTPHKCQMYQRHQHILNQSFSASQGKKGSPHVLQADPKSGNSTISGEAEFDTFRATIGKMSKNP
jgi:hypothetical protein